MMSYGSRVPVTCTRTAGQHRSMQDAATSRGSMIQQTIAVLETLQSSNFFHRWKAQLHTTDMLVALSKHWNGHQEG